MTGTMTRFYNIRRKRRQRGK